MARYSEDTQTKVLGGLIAKRIAQRAGQPPEHVSPDELDHAARRIIAKQGGDKGASVEVAKQDAARLLARARQMGSMRAAMDAYKRELRQLHEEEKRHALTPKQIMVIRGSAVAVCVVAAFVLSAYDLFGFIALAALCLPPAYVLFLNKTTKIKGPLRLPGQNGEQEKRRRRKRRRPAAGSSDASEQRRKRTGEDGPARFHLD